MLAAFMKLAFHAYFYMQSHLSAMKEASGWLESFSVLKFLESLASLHSGSSSEKC